MQHSVNGKEHQFALRRMPKSCALFRSARNRNHNITQEIIRNAEYFITFIRRETQNIRRPVNIAIFAVVSMNRFIVCQNDRNAAPGRTLNRKSGKRSPLHRIGFRLCRIKIHCFNAHRRGFNVPFGSVFTVLFYCVFILAVHLFFPLKADIPPFHDTEPKEFLKSSARFF